MSIFTSIKDSIKSLYLWKTNIASFRQVYQFRYKPSSTMSHSSSSAFYQHKTNLLLKSLSYMYMQSFCTTWQTWIIFQFSLLIFAYLILSLACLTLILACLLLINEKNKKITLKCYGVTHNFPSQVFNFFLRIVTVKAVPT